MRFRPDDDPRNVAEGEPVDWADNAASNFFAWASFHFTPTWCQAREAHLFHLKSHWTVRLADALWTTCPCCMVFRGVVLGAAAGFLFSTAVWLIAWSVWPQ